jgi:hypothetical protein
MSFKEAMIHALLREIEQPGVGKTQTRRPLEPQPASNNIRACLVGGDVWRLGVLAHAGVGDTWRSPYGQPSDLIWVRETWGVGSRPCPFEGGVDGIEYRADEVYMDANDLLPLHQVELPDGVEIDDYQGGWNPSTRMPRCASRITLHIEDVRVERIRDIGETDARAEGIADGGCLSCGESEPCGCNDPHPDARDSFIWLWNSIHGSDSWHRNDWVWVYQFRPILVNVDDVLADPARYGIKEAA